MHEELVEELRRPHADCDPWALMTQAAEAIEEMANKLCDWCGVCPKEKRRPWECEIMWPDAPVPEVWIEPPKEENMKYKVLMSKCVYVNADSVDEAMDKAADGETVYEEEEPVEATEVDEFFVNL